MAPDDPALGGAGTASLVLAVAARPPRAAPRRPATATRTRIMRPLRAAASLALLALFAGPLAAQQPGQQSGQPTAQPPAATPSHRAAVRELLEATHIREMLDKSSEAMLQSQLKQMPQLVPVADVIRDFYHEQMDWKVMEPELTQLYLEVFTEQELRDITAFYKTPLGQKMLAKMPQLMARSSELANARVQAALPKLMERMQAAMQKQAALKDSTTSSSKP